MADFLAWSYSRLKMFLNCPGQLWHTSVVPKGHPDRVEYVETDAMRAGKEIDNALTKRISLKTPLPAKYAKHEALCQMIIDHPGHKITQAEFALDQSLRSCGYRDWNTAWVRVIFDLVILDGPRGWIWDWKNGKISIDAKQLKLFAAVGFHQFPSLEVIDTSYVWLSHDHISPEVYYRRELPELWGEFIPDVERMQVSFRTQHWPKTPQNKTPDGVSVCKWCEVNKAGKCPVAAVAYGGR
jgi:hypothetical protein